MFDKYGNFDSAEELNAFAETLMNDENADGVRNLAAENGIWKEAAEQYINGETFELTNKTDAAIGKIEMERQELAIEGVIEDWISFIETECVKDERIAEGVRRKDKSLAGCTAQLLLYSLMNQKKVDEAILKEVKNLIKKKGIDLKKETGMEPRWLDQTRVGIPGQGKTRKIIREYYLGGGGNG